MNGDTAPDFQPMEVLIKKLENSDLITFHQIAKRLRDEEDILWRLNLLLDLGEFCLKAQAAFVLRLFRSRFTPQQRIDYEAAVKGLIDATLGKWIGCIELRQKFPALALDSLFNAEFKKSADRLSDIRNRYAHDATPARSQLVEITEQLRGAVTGILNNFLNRALVFVIEPKPQSATSRPEWGRVYLEWDGRKTDLFPWLVAKIERDETVGIFAFNDFRKKDTPSFVDHGRGGQHTSFSPAADTCGLPPVFDPLAMRVSVGFRGLGWWCFGGREGRSLAAAGA